MLELSYFDGGRPRAQPLARVVAEAVSHLALPVLALILRPFVWVSRSGRPQALERSADRVILLLAGDGVALRMAGERAGRRS
jgi:hypothetical protein